LEKIMATLEEKFASRLASNEVPVRNRALKRLSKWVEARSALEDGSSDAVFSLTWVVTGTSLHRVQ
jgi:hypothetical protein